MRTVRGGSKSLFTARAHTAFRVSFPATMLLFAALSGACAAAGTSNASDELRVLVYNIHAGKDAAGERNLDAVARLVQATRADVALLQEVDRGTTRSGGEDHDAVLSELTGHRSAFGRTLDYQGGEYGIAVLARWPIGSNGVRPLVIDPPQERAGGSYEPRGAQSVTVDRPGSELHVVNTHLDASGGDHYRRQEVAQVIQLADSLRSLGGTVVIGGDFNAEPGSAVVEAMLAAGWRDAWAECGRGDGRTYPAVEPVKRIDYLVIPQGIGCTDAEVIATETSDHRPLLVILRVER